MLQSTESVRRAAPIVVVAVVPVAAAVLSQFGSATLHRNAMGMLINVILVVGLYIFVGNSGVLSFGHVGLMAFGAYLGALLMIPPANKKVLLPDLPSLLGDRHLSVLAAMVVVAVVAVVFAYVIAGPLMRLSGLAASLATFAVLLIVHNVAISWKAYTRGGSVMIGIPTVANLGMLSACVIATIIGAHLFQRSRLGLRLRASRDDEVAARAVGVNVNQARRIAFVVSAIPVSAAGVLYGAFYGSFAPGAFYLELTFLSLAMLIIGGIKSLSGAVLGTVLVTATVEALRLAEDGVDVGPLQFESLLGISQIGVALVMLLVLILRPEGLTLGREISWPRRRIPEASQDSKEAA